jgi:hypothetical protein
MKLLALGLCLSCTLVVAQRSSGSEVALPAGTAVSVKLADPIDSALDPAGRQYAASLAAPVQIVGGETIAAGSQATVVLIRNNSGWITKLTALTVNGRKFDVASSGGVPIASKPAASSGVLQRMGISPEAPPATDHRLLLPSATELRFRLIGSSAPSHAVKSTPRIHAAAHTERSSDSSSGISASTTLEQEQPGIAYLCTAKDTSDGVLPVSYYLANVFETSDDPVLVERRWYDFLVATYPYRFANNRRAIVQCKRLTDVADERDARAELERESKSENAQIIETRWHYTLGPPPTPATSTVSSPQKRGSRP